MSSVQLKMKSFGKPLEDHESRDLSWCWTKPGKLFPKDFVLEIKVDLPEEFRLVEE